MKEFFLLVSWLPHKILNRETHRGHRVAQFHRATGGDGQRLERSNCFQQSQIIRRIHLHHRCVNQACAREQTHFGRTLDDVIIGNQITILRDETTVPVRRWTRINKTLMGN